MIIVKKKYIKKFGISDIVPKGRRCQEKLSTMSQILVFYSFEILDEYTTYEGQAWGYCFKPGDCNCSQNVQVIKEDRQLIEVKLNIQGVIEVLT